MGVSDTGNSYYFDRSHAGPVKLWLFTDRVVLPGMSHPIDLNVTNMTLDELRTWFGVGAQVPPDVPTSETPITKIPMAYGRTNTNGLAVLKSPVAAGRGGEIARIINASGTAIEIWEKSLDCYRISETKQEWVRSNYVTIAAPPPTASVLYRALTNTYGLAVFDTPGGHITRIIDANRTPVSVVGTQSNWSQIGPNEWVKSNYLTRLP